VSIYQVLLFVVSLIDCTGFYEFNYLVRLQFLQSVVQMYADIVMMLCC